MTERATVSFVIPALNEEDGLRAALDDVPAKALAATGHHVEVVVVDGESTDATREVAMEAGARVIVEPRRGYGRAYKTGFEHARGDIIVTGDADGTYPFGQAPALIARLQEDGLGFITTDRFADVEPGAMSAKHRFGNFVLSATTRVLFRIAVRDSQSGMWVFRRDVLPRLHVTSDGMAFSEEIKIEAFRAKGVKAIEVPITYRRRVGEVKLQSTRDGLKNLAFLFKKRFGPG